MDKGKEDTNYLKDYLTLCMKYRLLSLGLSSIAWSFTMLHERRGNTAFWGILTGMLISCLLGNHLYLSSRKDRLAAGILFAMELLAYGIFIFLSGGIFSPFIWYFLSCILLSLNGDRHHAFLPALAVVWGILCAVLGEAMEIGTGAEPDLNILIGIIIIVGAFYVFRSYALLLTEGRRELAVLNRQLEEENLREKYALQQIRGMYEGFSLMALTNPEQVLQKLAELIAGSISAGGCEFIIRSPDGSVTTLGSGIGEDTGERLLEWIRGLPEGMGAQEGGQREERSITIRGKRYEVLRIGSGSYGEAMLILDADSRNSREKEFYLQLARSMLREVDIQRQLEGFISAEEKNRIADELHDTVIQKLFGLSCGLRVLGAQAEQIGKDALKERLEELRGSAALTMKELRDAIYGRQFEAFGEKSFEGRIRSYMEEAEHLHAVRIDTELDLRSEALSAAEKIVVYRTICEAVNNAIRHGMAKQIRVRVHTEENGTEICVEDDGSGFEKGKGTGGGRGLKNLYGMAALFKGTLLLENREEQGARVILRLPMRK